MTELKPESDLPETVEESFADATLPGHDAELLVQTEFPEDEFPDPPQDARDLGEELNGGVTD